MNGADILILIEGELVGSQRGVSREETTESIDMSSKTSRARRVIPGRYASTMSLDGLYVPDDTAYGSLKDAMRDGTLVTVLWQEEGVNIETAEAVVTSLGAEAPDQDAATVSISLDIDGEWTEVTT